MPIWNNPLRAIGLAFALLVLAPLDTGCSRCGEPEDDETAIRALVDKAARMAERHALGELMDLTTDDFKAQPGPRSRGEVKRVMLMAFRRYGKLTIRYPRVSIDLAPSKDAAEVTTPFLVVREGHQVPDVADLTEDPAGWLEEVGKLADPYHLRLSLVKDGSDWMVKVARLRGVRSLSGI